MARNVAVFCFGSFFINRFKSKDIDLLLVHEDTTAHSCAFAIRCKRSISQIIKLAHITILSVSEEQYLNFINKANAQLLGTIEEDNFGTDISAISRLVTAPLEASTSASKVKNPAVRAQPELDSDMRDEAQPATTSRAMASIYP